MASLSKDSLIGAEHHLTSLEVIDTVRLGGRAARVSLPKMNSSVSAGGFHKYSLDLTKSVKKKFIGQTVKTRV